MTAPSNTELVRNILSKYPGTTQTPVNPVAVEELLSLLQAREQQLLTEIVGESIWYQEGGSSPKKAVPVSVIQSKIGELNG